MVSLHSKYNCWNKRRLHYVNPKRRSMSVRDKYDGGPYWHLYNIVKQNTSSFRGIAHLRQLQSIVRVSATTSTKQSLCPRLTEVNNYQKPISILQQVGHGWKHRDETVTPWVASKGRKGARIEHANKNTHKKHSNHNPTSQILDIHSSTLLALKAGRVLKIYLRVAHLFIIVPFKNFIQQNYNQSLRLKIVAHANNCILLHEY